MLSVSHKKCGFSAKLKQGNRSQQIFLEAIVQSSVEVAGVYAHDEGLVVVADPAEMGDKRKILSEGDRNTGSDSDSDGTVAGLGVGNKVLIAPESQLKLGVHEESCWTKLEQIVTEIGSDSKAGIGIGILEGIEIETDYSTDSHRLIQNITHLWQDIEISTVVSGGEAYLASNIELCVCRESHEGEYGDKNNFFHFSNS